MATNYPGALDSLTNPSAGDALTSPSHSAQHANANDAIEAIETELGTNPKGSAATVKARLDAIETGARLGTNSVGATQLADSAVDTAAIQDGAVTPAKMARQVGNCISSAAASGTGGWTTDGTATYNTPAGKVTITGGTYFLPDAVTPQVTASYHQKDAAPGETWTATVDATATGGTVQITLIFVDAAGATLTQVVGNYISAGQTGQLRVTGIAPANTTAVCIGIYGTATSRVLWNTGLWRGTGGQWALPGTPILGLTDAPIGNLLPLALADGSDASLWAVSGCTRSVVSGAVEMVATGTGATYLQSNAYAITPSQTHTITAKVRNVSGSRQIRLDGWWYDASGTGITSFASTVTTSASDIVLSATAVAPSNAATIRLFVSQLNTGSAGDTTRIDEVGLWCGAAGRWQLPGVPIPGQSAIATNGAVNLSGTGTPEGVVVAAPGSTWQQTDATTDVKGWLRWIKATGTGNTGWVAGPEADTGWRDYSASLDNGWAGTLYLRRVGQLVHVHGSLTGTSASSHLALSSNPLPSGFRPKSAVQRAVSRNASLADSIHVEIVTNGEMAMWSGNGDGASQIVSETFLAASTTWPSSLPGTAA